MEGPRRRRSRTRSPPTGRHGRWPPRPDRPAATTTTQCERPSHEPEIQARLLASVDREHDLADTRAGLDAPVRLGRLVERQPVADVDAHVARADGLERALERLADTIGIGAAESGEVEAHERSAAEPQLVRAEGHVVGARRVAHPDQSATESQQVEAGPARAAA